MWPTNLCFRPSGLSSGLDKNKSLKENGSLLKQDRHFVWKERPFVTIVTVIKAVALLAAAGILGNWFLAEVKEAKKQQKPWYQPYLSPPGLLILLALALPLIVWMAR